MSLDDETPTQYFGPDGRNWVHPVTGKMIRLSPTDYERAEQRKAEWFAGQENKTHRTGCPIERTGRCSCAYLAQWDDDAEATHDNTVQFNADGTVALQKWPEYTKPEIRYGAPPIDILEEDLPPGGVLYIPEYLRNNLGDLGKFVSTDVDGNPLTLAGKDVAAAERDANKALEERDRQVERADAWRSTAYLMLGTLACILLGVIGREFGWY